MKIQIRRSLFETNSSSIHSLTMCSDSDYEKWKSGEYIYDIDDDELIPLTDEIKISLDNVNEHQYFTYKNFFEDYILDYEVFAKTFTTENGEVVHAFGYYGNGY